MLLMGYPKDLEQEFEFLSQIKKAKAFLQCHDDSEDEQIDTFLKNLRDWGATISTVCDASKFNALTESLKLFTKSPDNQNHKFPKMIAGVQEVFKSSGKLTDIDKQIHFLDSLLNCLKEYCIGKADNGKKSTERKKHVCRLFAATAYQHLKERRKFKEDLREEIRTSQKMSGASVDEVHGNLAIVEPAITSDIKKIYGKYLSEAGLKFKIKGLESLKRKIVADTEAIYKNSVGYLFVAKNNMHDCIRYTILVANDELVPKFLEWDKKMESEGYLKLRVKNFWTKPGAYKGINTVYATPYGYFVEIQFHSNESFELKEGTLHKLYEEQRVLDKSDPRWQELQKRMEDESKKLGMPENIDKISDYVRQGRFAIKIEES